MPAEGVAADPGLPSSMPTEAYWQCPPHAIASHQSPELPSHASVVIIGSGLTGTSVAYHLLRRSPNMKVVMLEARTVSSGATGRNGGHCKDATFKTYRKLRAKVGRNLAKRIAKFRSSHVDATRQIARQLYEDGYGDAQFRDVESLTAVFHEEVFQDLKHNLAALLEDFPDESGRYSISDGAQAEKKYGLLGACGVISSPAAALWPYRLVTGLLERLINEHPPFSLEALTTVSSISTSNDLANPYLVHTSRGTICARNVVHCTNGHVSQLLPALRNKIVSVRGQMTALAPSDQFPRLGGSRSWSLCWRNGGFDYMTQAADAEGLVFLGGGVEQAAKAGVVDLGVADDSSLNRPALEHLSSVLPERFESGQGTRIYQAWTGIMGFTPDGFPLVGKIPQEVSHRRIPEDALGHEWIAAGFSGYGMVHCWQSGRAIADMISGQSEKEIEAYFPAELFQCSGKRLESMDLGDLRSVFYKNAPAATKSRL